MKCLSESLLDLNLPRVTLSFRKDVTCMKSVLKWTLRKTKVFVIYPRTKWHCTERVSNDTIWSIWKISSLYYPPSSRMYVLTIWESSLRTILNSLSARISGARKHPWFTVVAQKKVWISLDSEVPLIMSITSCAMFRFIWKRRKVLSCTKKVWDISD